MASDGLWNVIGSQAVMKNLNKIRYGMANEDSSPDSPTLCSPRISRNLEDNCRELCEIAREKWVEVRFISIQQLNFRKQERYKPDWVMY